MAISKLKCRGCGDRFKRETMVSYDGGRSHFHDAECANQHSRKSKQQAKGKKIIDKAWRADTAERKKRAKSKGKWAEEAQAEFNRFIRLRDHNQPCISCDTMSNSVKYDAGHYKSVGGNLELRFEPLNCHKQCSNYCNKHRSGNAIEYRKRLKNRIGEDKVEWLEGPHEPKRYQAKDYERIKLKYKVKADELEKRIESGQASI